MSDRHGRTRMGAAAALLAGSVFLSRVIGYLREVALANQVGAGPEMDAYRAAFQIPDLLNYLLAGGAFSLAFLPLYTRVREQRGEDAAQRLFRTVLGTVGCVAVGATVLLFAQTDRLIALLFPDFSPEIQALAVRLTRIVLPAQIFFLTGGIVRAALMAEGRFGAHAVAPLVYTGCAIAGGVWAGSAEGFAWGVLVGAVLGPFAIPALDLRRVQRLGARVAPLDPDFRTYLWIALPLMVGLSLATVDEWYERYFGAQLGPGVVAQLGYARMLMIAPVAVIGQAIATAALPTLTRLWNTGRHRELDLTLLRTLQGSLALALLAAAGLVALADPLIEVIYRHGRFGEQDARRVASILTVLACGVPAWVSWQVAVRSFYAREETWRPMLLNTAIALLAIPLYPFLGARYEAEGLAAAGVMAMSVNALATLGWGRVRHGAPALGALSVTALRASVVAAASGVAASSAAAQVDWTSREGAFLALVVGGTAFAVVAALGVAVAGDEATRSAVGSFLRRLRVGRSSGDAG